MGTENGFDHHPGYVDLVNLIRSIQRAEGNLDCYRVGRRQCDRLDCTWRNHCLEKTGEQPVRSFPDRTPENSSKLAGSNKEKEPRNKRT